MMWSSSFETHDLREIGRKEADESRVLSHLMDGKNRSSFAVRRRMQILKKIEDVKIDVRAREVLQNAVATLFGPVANKEKRSMAASRNLLKVNGEQKGE